jgi:periplasmic protein CpxP/Spy
MTTMPSICRAALIAAFMTAPGFALAQTTAAAPSPAPAATPASASSSSAGTDTAAAQARVEAHIKQLHAQLHITAAEDPQWKAFADVMRENAQAIGDAAAQRVQQLPTMTAVQDLQSFEQLTEAHVQRLQKLIPAFETLYDSMSPQQKQLADRVFRGTAERHAEAHHRG